MAITFVSAGTTSDASPSVPGIPASLLDNDLMLLFCESHSAETPATPTGWTLIESKSTVDCGVSANLTSTRLTIFYRFFVSGDTGPSITVTNHVTTQILAWRGVKTTGNPWNLRNSACNGTASTSVSQAGPNPTTVDGCKVVAAVSNGFDGAGTSTAEFSAWANSSLTNVTERADFMGILGNGGGFGVADGDQATAGDTGTWTATMVDSFAISCQIIALEPIAVTAPTLRWQYLDYSYPGS